MTTLCLMQWAWVQQEQSFAPQSREAGITAVNNVSHGQQVSRNAAVKCGIRYGHQGLTDSGYRLLAWPEADVIIKL
jgi:hypothetical protein